MRDKRTRLFSILHALSATRFTPLRGDDLRDARLSWLTTFCARQIRTSKDLTDDELQRSVSQMLREVEPAAARRYRWIDGRATRLKRAGNVIEMSNRNAATSRQVWMIHRIEQYLGWDPNPGRLGGFLSQVFRVPNAESLTFLQAHKAIESLFATGAREAVKHRLGDDHQVGREELAAEVARLKRAIHSWTPTSPDPPEAA